MPDYKELRAGDQILLLRVPQADLDQRKREVEENCEEAGSTANTIERVMQKNPIVMIDRIDEYGYPWFECNLESEQGLTEEHSIAIMENDSWEAVS